MSKATLTRLFIGSLIAVISGTIVAIAAVWVAIANDVFVMAGTDITGIRGSALAWSVLGLGFIGAMAIAAGLIAGIVSWIGTLLHTWRLDSRTWFVALLLLGILNLWFFAMVAYLIAGPDDTIDAAPRTALAPAGS
jgi:MFS family permease